MIKTWTAYARFSVIQLKKPQKMKRKSMLAIVMVIFIIQLWVWRMKCLNINVPNLYLQYQNIVDLSCCLIVPFLPITKFVYRRETHVVHCNIARSSLTYIWSLNADAIEDIKISRRNSKATRVRTNIIYLLAWVWLSLIFLDFA